MMNKKLLDDIFFKAQIILFIILLVLALLSLKYKFLFNYAVLLSGVILCVMGYNNLRVFKRKSMTIIYEIFGIIVIAIGIGKLVG